MNIVLVTEFFPESSDCETRGGVEARTFFIAKYLAKNNKVCVIANREKGIHNGVTTINGVMVKRVGLAVTYSQSKNLIGRLIYFFSVIFVRLPFKPDLVDAQAIVSYVPGYILALRNRVKKVVTLHDSWIGGGWYKLFGFLGIVGEIYERFFLSLAWNGIIANSSTTLAKLPPHTQKRKHTVVYNGFDKNEFLPFLSSIQEKPRSICYVGRLVAYKNVNNLLAALSRLQLDFTCHIIGSGPHEEKLKTQAESLGLQNRVIFHGYLKEKSEVLRILSQVKVFTLPSAVEGFGIVTIEAAVLQKPYVNSDIPATKEITKNGLGGLLFEVNNIRQYADALTELLTDEKLYSQKKHELSNLVHDYEWQDKANETMHFYKSICT
ncbi:MAG: glycosyltransferase [Patescibacteria group bacterium]|jgi:glycosyltransferase involved in cell wall biosynthesis